MRGTLAFVRSASNASLRSFHFVEVSQSLNSAGRPLRISTGSARSNASTTRGCSSIHVRTVHWGERVGCVLYLLLRRYHLVRPFDFVRIVLVLLFQLQHPQMLHPTPSIA